jgi:acetyl-CoA acyltransferase
VKFAINTGVLHYPKDKLRSWPTNGVKAMNKVIIAGVGSSQYGRFVDTTLKQLSLTAVEKLFSDNVMTTAQVEKVFFANAAAGIMTEQEMVRGQALLRGHPLARVPLINIENACASSGSALHLAFQAIRYGELNCAVVVGAEKLNHVHKDRAFRALWGATDIEEIGPYPSGESTRSVLMEYYAGVAQKFLDSGRVSIEDFARIAVKNRANAALNPIAQFRRTQTVEEVLGAQMIASPLTLPMCAPLTDGATAILICSEELARAHGLPLVEIKACTMAGSPGVGVSPVRRATEQAYAETAYGPRDMDLIELHDAAAPAEILQYSEIGLCDKEQLAEFIASGATSIDGKYPVNTSGGLLSRGHALGATGSAQIAEIFDQLTNAAGQRQLADPVRGMAVNGGGWMDGTYILAVCTIIETMH